MNKDSRPNKMAEEAALTRPSTRMIPMEMSQTLDRALKARPTNWVFEVMMSDLQGQYGAFRGVRTKGDLAG